ncbi:hypothetical protein H0V99_02830 [Candidatus Saccharibacteria bacterium]|nr:hypothetical protein [Candidatus Saccharibacteria bacterium]
MTDDAAFELGGAKNYLATSKEIELADYAAIITADFPGVTFFVCSILERDISIEEKNAYLTAIDNKAILGREHAIATMIPEEISPWSNQMNFQTSKNLVDPCNTTIFYDQDNETGKISLFQAWGRTTANRWEVESHRQPRRALRIIGNIAMSSVIAAMAYRANVGQNLLPSDPGQLAIEAMIFSSGLSLSFTAKHYL